MIITYSILKLLIGIGVFLLGINLFTDTLKKRSLKKMESLFNKVGENRWSGVTIGASVTALTQSSTAVTVMTVSFVNLGILTLFQATAIIMGSNIGTTLTGFLVVMSAFDVKYIFMFFVFVGLVIEATTKKEKMQWVGEILTYLGLVFVGLDILGSAFRGDSPLKDFFSYLFTNISFPLVLLLLGTLFTGLIQSSTATMAIYITMASEGILGIDSAIYLIMGAEIGTCFTSVISSIGTNVNAKRAAFTHLVYNVAGTIIFMLIIYPMSGIIIPWYKSIIKDPAMQITLFPPIYNITSVLLFVWFIKPFNKLMCYIIKEKPEKDKQLTVHNI